MVKLQIIAAYIVAIVASIYGYFLIMQGLSYFGFNNPSFDVLGVVYIIIGIIFGSATIFMIAVHCWVLRKFKEYKDI